MKRIAVFPGSFDPFTIGHESIVCRSLDLFDEIIVAVGKNSTKGSMFSLEKRIGWIQEIFKDVPKVSVDSYEGLTVEYCRRVEAGFILRGLRTSADFNYERPIAQMNKTMLYSVESIFMMTLPELSAISSTVIRDIVRNGGDASPFVPQAVKF
jgi:pantetheine-phosphate adenylyltransferase